MNLLKRLFEPICLGGVELENRIVFLAVTTNYGDNGLATRRFNEFYIARARGGAGLVTVGLFWPCQTGAAPSPRVSLGHDRFIPTLRELTDAIHSYGAKAAAQLCLQYQWVPDEGAAPEYVGPSEVVTRPGVKPRPLSVGEIQRIVGEFGEAARRARDDGFDAVEIHAGIGYLINRFLSPVTNKRTDRYGGSLESRARFLLEIVDSAKRKAGQGFAILCRVSAEEFMEGGHTLAESKRVAAMLEEAGIHALNVQAGWHEAPRPLIQSSVPPGAFVYLAQGIKEVVKIPVVAAYRVSDPLLAERILAEGRADLIGMARALIADPELPRKARAGRFDEIRPCIACCRCLDLTLGGEPVACSVNPWVGRDGESAPRPAATPKKVLIVGAGPGGMQAALAAAQAGHQVTLAEREAAPGGNLMAASVAPFKGEISAYARYLTNQVQKAGVTLRLNCEVTAETVGDMAPDAVILATGASTALPDIPGIHCENVASAIDVLLGRRKTGQKVLVIGGGMVGCETAEFLAAQGKQVTIVERLGHLGADMGRATRWVNLQRLRKAGVRMETDANVVRITDGGVEAVRQDIPLFFEGDTIVIATGMAPNNRLVREIEGGFPCFAIGDCVAPRRIAQTTEEAIKAVESLSQ